MTFTKEILYCSFGAHCYHYCHQDLATFPIFYLSLFSIITIYVYSSTATSIFWTKFLVLRESRVISTCIVSPPGLGMNNHGIEGRGNLI